MSWAASGGSADAASLGYLQTIQIAANRQSYLCSGRYCSFWRQCQRDFGGPIQFASRPELSQLTDEEINQLRAIADKTLSEGR